MKVFADLMSQPARAVIIFCRAAGIPHEHVNIRINAGDNKTDEYTKMNPFQKIPVIKDGDFALSESVAIFRYLARDKGVADHCPVTAGHRQGWMSTWSGSISTPG